MARRHHKTDKVWHERFWPLLENKKLGKNERYVFGPPEEGSDASDKAFNISMLLVMVAIIAMGSNPTFFDENWLLVLLMLTVVLSPILLVDGLKGLKAATLEKRKKAIQAQLDRR